MHQGAVIQHRQIKPTAIPGDQLWRVFFDAVEKALDIHRFVFARQRPHAEAFVGAQRAGDDQDAMHGVL